MSTGLGYLLEPWTGTEPQLLTGPAPAADGRVRRPAAGAAPQTDDATASAPRPTGAAAAPASVEEELELARWGFVLPWGPPVDPDAWIDADAPDAADEGLDHEESAGAGAVFGGAAAASTALGVHGSAPVYRLGGDLAHGSSDESEGLMDLGALLQGGEDMVVLDPSRRSEHSEASDV